MPWLSRALRLTLFVVERLHFVYVFRQAASRFTAWLDGLKDSKVRGAVAERIKRLTFGLQGDFKPVGGGVIELRIDLGAGWRLYTHKLAR
ncbi:MAG TPA: type II toxin-antitoxin system RelE/ParE family toxin [Terracidiphilus sp.]